MGEIVRDITDRSPNEALVRELEALLESARSGELRSAIIVTASADNGTGFRSVVDARTWWQPLLGEMAYAQNEVLLDLSRRRDAGVLRNL